MACSTSSARGCTPTRSAATCSSSAIAVPTVSRSCTGAAHGLCLWCQRLEAGRYHFPDAPNDAATLERTAGPFQMVLDGLDLSRVRRFKRFATC
jgi:hypothetical protein